MSALASTAIVVAGAAALASLIDDARTWAKHYKDMTQ